MLIPITCPVCGAAVELEEGQSVVRCPFCKTSSYLAKPSIQVAAPPPLGAKRPGAVIFIAFLAVAVAIGIAAFYFGGVGTNYYDDARPAAELLDREFGKDARYVSLLMHPSYMHARVMRDDKLIAVRIYGRTLEKPDTESSPNPKELEAALFDLRGVDFGVVAKIVRHARKRAKDAELSHVLLERPRKSQLLWAVGMTASGDSIQFFYDLEGKPLVEEPLRFLTTTPQDLGDRLKKHIGFEPNVVSIYLGTDHARVVVLTPKSNRDTDAYSFFGDGTASGPQPNTSDGDAQELAKQVFGLGDIRWNRVPGVVADAGKRLGADIQQLSFRRRNGRLEMHLYGTNARGASRAAWYDLDGRFLE